MRKTVEARGFSPANHPVGKARASALGFCCAALALLLVATASSTFAGTVTGTVRNGTTGKPAAGVDMILIQLQGTMQPVANTKTDADGHYKFDHPGLGAGPMLIRAVYRGVNYHEPATPDKTTVDMMVYEPTDKPSAIAVTVHAVIVQPEGSDLSVTEEYSISNKTQPPVAYYRADGNFVFSLPEGAQLGNVSAGGSSGMPVVQSPVDKGHNTQSIAYPFRPGDSQVSLTYKVPYPGNRATLPINSRYAVDHLGVFAPPSVQVSGDGFAPAGQAQGFSAYTRESVAANTPLSVTISGTAPPPPQEGAAAGGAPSDDTQNPSVNSRVETGNEAPVASLTTLPARLDSLKWIIVGGFAALFALGSLYVARQPQGSVVAEASSASVAAAPPFPAMPPASSQSSPSGAGTASASASLDREVRGSLDEMKDLLFRLELRREAGTITEADYARERDRVQKALRDLVKG
jgi:hypothetical protein